MSRRDEAAMRLEFEGRVIGWHGPAPYVFIEMPEEASGLLKKGAAELSYGWGCIPVLARLGATSFRSSLMPKDGRYLLPIKVLVQKAESVAVGETRKVAVEIAR